MQASPGPDPLTPLTATGHLCTWNFCAVTLTIALALQLKTQLDEKAGEVKQANDDLIEKVITRLCAVYAACAHTAIYSWSQAMWVLCLLLSARLALSHVR